MQDCGSAEPRTAIDLVHIQAVVRLEPDPILVGVPLRTHDGFNLGTLCVIDRHPRAVTERQVSQLEALASIVMDQMELRLSARRAIADLARLVARVRRRNKRLWG